MKKLTVFLLSILFFLLGCSEEKLLSPSERISQVDVRVEGLNAPGDSAHYEAWLKWLNKTNAGDFEIYENLGTLESTGGSYTISKNLNQGYMQGALAVIISIETDTASQPSAYRIIGADLEANDGTFTIGSGDVLNFSFELASGYYFLDTPTERPTSLNPKSGIWFARLDTTIEDIQDSLGNVVGQDTTVDLLPGLELQDLTLPGLSANWSYQGWVIIDGDTLPTGKFLKPEGADQNSDYKGPGQGYPFPGSDFLSNAPAGMTFPLDLSGREVLITLTPNYPAKANKPFSLTVMGVQIPANAQARHNYRLNNESATFPGGDLTVTVTLYK
jgi:hypothetical protein